MSYAHMRDGTVYHFPVLRGPDSPIEIPSADEIARVAREARATSLPVFTKSLVSCAIKHGRKERYAAVNKVRLAMAQACIERMLTEARA